MSNSIALSPEQFIFAQGEELRTTSLKIAEAFEKRHDHVIRDIRKIIEATKDLLTAPKFGECQRINELANNKPEPYYEMDKDGFMLVVMGYTGEKAMAIKMAYINAFNAMQAKLFPTTQYGLKSLPEPPTITKAQEGILFNRVKTISSGSGKIRAELWSRFQNHFKLSSYKALPTDAFDEAMDYLDLKEQEYSQGVEMLWISRTELNEMVEKQLKALPAPAPLEGDLLHTPQHNKLSFDLAPLRAGETRRWLITQLATDAAMFHPLAPDQQVLTQQEAINALQQDYIVIKKSEVLGRLEA